MNKQSYLSSPLNAETVIKVRGYLETIRENPSDKENRKLFISTVYHLTEEATNYFFLEPLDIIKAGKITRKFVNIGVSGSLKLINSVGSKVSGSLSDEQILELADFVDSLILDKPDT